jgi:hypothetical protein
VLYWSQAVVDSIPPAMKLRFIELGETPAAAGKAYLFEY